MSELREQRWSVMSERGREAARLSYADAAALARSLTVDKVHGLCVVTDEAAERLAAQTVSPNGDQPQAAKKGGARRKNTKMA
jgi:hypothetical protein